MRRLWALARFLWDFVIGDDWPTAVGIAIALAVTALVAETGVPAWWILPVGVIALLAASVWRAARASS